jgi:hypothetical protein
LGPIGTNERKELDHDVCASTSASTSTSICFAAPSTKCWRACVQWIRLRRAVLVPALIPSSYLAVSLMWLRASFEGALSLPMAGSLTKDLHLAHPDLQLGRAHANHSKTFLCSVHAPLLGKPPA